MPFFGAHMSVSGGIQNAFSHIQEVDGHSLQVFTRNQRQWNHKPLSDEEIHLFTAAWREWKEGRFVVSHGSYLINLATPKDDSYEKAVNGLAAEIERCAKLGIGGIVLHPGSHLGKGLDAGTTRIAEGLQRAYDVAAEAVDNAHSVSVFLENLAGQGNVIGGRFSELAMVLEKCRCRELINFCVDTCHGFAAGYDISTVDGAVAMIDDFNKEIGLDRLKIMHLNDSKAACGSNTDRHEHIGKGQIGIEGFQAIVNHAALQELPMIIETPKEGSLVRDKENLQLLNSLVG